MDGKVDVVTLISLIVAIVVILKLRSVLGRRNDDDASRIERQRAQAQERQAQQQQAAERQAQDKVIALPRRERDDQRPQPATQTAVDEAETRIKSLGLTDPAVTNGLLAILKLDNAFDPEHFIKGARQAYEMIVTAFAEGNRKLLKDLLSREVFDGFVAAIADRESRGEQIDQSFVGISKADILEADAKAGQAIVTVRFVSQLISATRDAKGAVINGDPQKIKEVTDIWTFSRDISTARARANPNWRLVGTQAPN